MDRIRSSRSFDQRAMLSDRFVKSYPLLSSIARRCFEFSAYEKSRRDLHRKALPRVQANNSDFEKRRLPSQSKTNPRDYESSRNRRDSTRAQYFKESSRTRQIPLFITRSSYHATRIRMEHGYYVYSLARRLCVSCSCDRLVQSIGSRVSSIQQSRGGILFGGLRGSGRSLREAGDFQYGSGSAIFFASVCRRHTKQRDSFQYGWSRASARQYFCRTSMEICKI